MSSSIGVTAFGYHATGRMFESVKSCLNFSYFDGAQIQTSYHFCCYIGTVTRLIDYMNSFGKSNVLP